MSDKDPDLATVGLFTATVSLHGAEMSLVQNKSLNTCQHIWIHFSICAALDQKSDMI